MKLRLKRSLSFMLILALLVSMSVVPVSAEPANVTVSTAMAEVAMSGGNQIYKLVFSANSIYGISAMGTVMSYDNTVIVPVHRSTYANITGLANGANFYALKAVLMDPSGDTPYGIKHYYYHNAARDAFLCDIYSDNPLTSMGGSLPVFEFYFRLADGKTVTDLNAMTFRIETDKSEGSFLNAIYNTAESLAANFGLLIADKNPSGDQNHIYSNSVNDTIGLTLAYTNSTKKIIPTIDTPPTASAITYGQSLANSTLSGGVASVSGTFSWTNDTITPAFSDSNTTEYSVTFTPTDSFVYDTATANIKLAVNKASITIPTVSNEIIKYNGNPQTVEIDLNAAYEISGNIGTNAGDYTATATLTVNTDNYQWSNGTIAPLSLPWSIAKGDPTVNVSYTGTLYTSSALPALTLTGGTPGTVTLNTGQTLTAGTNSYNWTFTPTDTANYNGATGTIDLTVTAVSIGSITVTAPPTYTEYEVFDTLNIDGMIVTATFNDGSTEDVTNACTFTYANGDSFRLGDTKVTVNYGGKTVDITGLTVAKKKIAKPDVTSGPLTYTGSAQQPTIATNDAYTITGNSEMAAGSYSATVALADTANYEWADGSITDLSLAWSIGKKTLTVGDGTYAISKPYDGTKGPGVATGSLELLGVVEPDDVSASIAPLPNYLDSTTGTYTMTLNLTLAGSGKDNYALASSAYDFTNAKIVTAKIAKPSASGILTYNGLLQSPTIAENNAYTITGNQQIIAGEHVATVSFGSNTNYEWEDGSTQNLSLDWSILPADYSVNVPATKQIKFGSPNTALPAAVTAGVSIGGNIEIPAGTLTWHSSTANRTAGTEIDAGYVASLSLGAGDADKDYTLYWKFVTTNNNYVDTAKEGSTVITIVNGDPQNIVINGKPGTVTYGDVDFPLTTTVTTTGGDPVVGGGAITWTSSNNDVASIDGDGKVTVNSAGTTTITASAAAVPGTYAAGSTTLTLNVEKKVLTVAAGTYKVSKIYDGTTSPGTPGGELTVTGALAGDAEKISVVPTPPAYATKAVVTDANLPANLSLTGESAANYQLATSTLSVPCSITQRDITGVSVTGVTKTYDGTIGAGNATITGTPTLTGKVTGDVLGIALTVASFSDGNAGTGKTADITLDALTGADSGNYNLTAVSPITATATITKATITGFVTAPPAATILANDANNTDAAKLKASGIALPDNVTVTYASGTASLPITWANATQSYNKKGGTYTYRGTVTNGSNFNAYAPTLDAVLTVTPVQITSITGVAGSMTKAKADVSTAADMTALGFPAQVTLTFDNAVADLDINTTWDATIAALKTLANTVTATTDKTKTVTLTNTNFPAWATMTGVMPSTLVTITNKLIIDPADITFVDATITFGDVLNQTATVNAATYPGATAIYAYTGTGATTYGPLATPPVNAGTYTVTATVENATHKGTKSASLTINPKALNTVTISVITDHGYMGSPISPAYEVTGDGTINLVAGTDYTGAFTANTNVGTATLTVTCKGNYTGTGTRTFNIIKTTPTITFTNTSQKLTSAGNNITDVVGALNPTSAGAAVTVHYWVVVTPKADCTVVHDDGCASLESGKTIADCDCTKDHKAHDIATCDYVAADVYGWVTTVPQTAGTYKLYGKTAGDANLEAVNNGAAPDAANVNDTLTISPYRSSGSGNVTTPPAAPPVVAPPATTGKTTTVTTTVTPTTTGTTSTAKVSTTDMNKAVDTAIKAATDTGTSTNVTVKVVAPPAAKKVEVALPTASIGTLAGQDDASMTVESGIGTITFDNDALSAIGEAATGNDIVLSVSDVDKKELNSEQQALVGDRPVIDLSILSGGKQISDFKGGSATVNIPYTLAEGEEPEGIVIWYLADDGRLEKKECVYDPVSKMATFVAEHFSQYVLAYFPFTDLNSGEWYYENAVYAYTNGLISGIGKDKFDPAGKTTRAMVVTILWRLEGQPKAADGTFKDVATGTWYTDAINWASANGIVSGYSDSKFGPDNTVTREQMAAIIYNYGTYKKYNMEGKADLAAFGDVSKVSAWAEAPVQWAVENGIISGTGKGNLDPKGSAQRAQVAAILQRFIENIK